MASPFKFIADEVVIFDIEYAPDLETARKCYDIDPETKIDAQLSELYDLNGADEENPQPMLKLFSYKVVSISAIIRKATESGLPSLRLFTLPDKPDLTEADIISRFLNYIGKANPQIVGFSSTIFDLTVLLQRALITGVKAPSFFFRPNKPWEGVDYFTRNGDYAVDLAECMAGYIPKSIPSLNEITRACGIPGKLGVDGSQVADMYFAGKLQDIINYNETDTASTYLLWLRMAEMMGKLPDGAYLAERDLFQSIVEKKADEGSEHFEEYLHEWARLDSDIVPFGANEPEEIDGVPAPPGTRVIADPLPKPPAESTEAPPEMTPPDDNPNVAKNLGDMLTAKQLAMVRGLSREVGVEAENECMAIMHCSLDELSKRAASDFIEHLQNVQHGLPMRKAPATKAAPKAPAEPEAPKPEAPKSPDEIKYADIPGVKFKDGKVDITSLPPDHPDYCPF